MGINSTSTVGVSVTENPIIMIGVPVVISAVVLGPVDEVVGGGVIIYCTFQPEC